jgi:hypothetical protein
MDGVFTSHLISVRTKIPGTKEKYKGRNAKKEYKILNFNGIQLLWSH